MAAQYSTARNCELARAAFGIEETPVGFDCIRWQEEIIPHGWSTVSYRDGETLANYIQSGAKGDCSQCFLKQAAYIHSVFNTATRIPGNLCQSFRRLRKARDASGRPFEGNSCCRTDRSVGATAGCADQRRGVREIRTGLCDRESPCQPCGYQRYQVPKNHHTSSVCARLAGSPLGAFPWNARKKS